MPPISITKQSSAPAHKISKNAAASSKKPGRKLKILDNGEDDDTIGPIGPKSTALTSRPVLRLKWSSLPYPYSPSDFNRPSNAHLNDIPPSIAALTNAELMQVLDSGIAFISSACDIPPSMSFALAALPTCVDKAGNLRFGLSYGDERRAGESYEPIGVMVDARGVIEKAGSGEGEEVVIFRELLCNMVKESEGLQGLKVMAPTVPRMQAVWWEPLGKRVPCLTLTWMVAVQEDCTVEFFN